VTLRGDEKISGRRHVGDPGDGHAVRFDPEKNRPCGQATNEGSCSVDRIHDEAELGVVTVSAGFLSEELRLRIFRQDILTDRLLGFAVGRRDRAAVGLLLRDDTFQKVLHRGVAGADDQIFERAHCAKSTNTIDVELDAHGLSMTCLTGSVKW